jgi:hypothetical protein
MPDKNSDLCIKIADKINEANSLAAILHAIIDVSYYTDMISLISNHPAGTDADEGILTRIIEICDALNVDINFQHYSMHLITSLKKYAAISRAATITSSSSVADSIIDRFEYPLQNFMCSQGKLIGHIISFCITAKINNEKIFNLFNEDVVLRWEEIKRFKLGLCYGLSTLFLLCSFISDMKHCKKTSVPEDDLQWFYRCVLLLQLNHHYYSSEELQDLTRFICLVVHFHNEKNVSGASAHIIFDSDSKQHSYDSHFKNVEFTGDHYISHSVFNEEEKEHMELLFKGVASLYMIFVLETSYNVNHAVSLHKSITGAFTFYDSSADAPIVELKLNTKKDFEKFKKEHLKTNIVKVTLGVHDKKVMQQLSSVASVEPEKKRLRPSPR